LRQRLLQQQQQMVRSSHAFILAWLGRIISFPAYRRAHCFYLHHPILAWLPLGRIIPFPPLTVVLTAFICTTVPKGPRDWVGLVALCKEQDVGKECVQAPDGDHKLHGCGLEGSEPAEASCYGEWWQVTPLPDIPKATLYLLYQNHRRFPHKSEDISRRTRTRTHTYTRTHNRYTHSHYTDKWCASCTPTLHVPAYTSLSTPRVRRSFFGERGESDHLLSTVLKEDRNVWWVVSYGRGLGGHGQPVLPGRRQAKGGVPKWHLPAASGATPGPFQVS
jgi:hypothetical protein